MNRVKLVISFGLSFLLVFLICCNKKKTVDGEDRADDLLIGWAQTDITPDAPVLLAGQFHTRVSEGVLDPVTATILAFEIIKEPSEKDLEKWTSSNQRATDEVGVTIVPNGRRDSSGKFYDKLSGSTIWISSETSQSCAYYRHFASKNATIGKNPEGDKKSELLLDVFEKDDFVVFKVMSS